MLIERGAELGGVHRRAPRFRGAGTEFRVRRRRPGTSATTRRAASRFARRGDGAMPSAGWTGDAEWTGWVPFDDLPHAFDPPEHAIVTANQRPMPAGYPYLLGVDWPEPYRAQRVTDLLGRTRTSRPTRSRRCRPTGCRCTRKRVLPVLLERAHPESPADRQALDLLRRWNRDARGDSGAAAIFEGVVSAPGAGAPRRRPRRGDDRQPRRALFLRHAISFSTRWDRVDRIYAPGASGVSRTWKVASARWCDDTRTPARETCDAVVTAALHDAVLNLTTRLGRRHDPAGDGTRFTAPCFLIRGSIASPRCARPQPVGAERRRLEHGQRRCCGGRPPLRTTLGGRLPRDHRPLRRQRQPIPRRARRIRTLPVAPLR